MRLRSGYLYYDTPVGILCLDTHFPKPPGQLEEPAYLRFSGRLPRPAGRRGARNPCRRLGRA